MCYYLVEFFWGEWQVYKEILDQFCGSTFIDASESKSCFLENGVDEETLSQIGQLFPYQLNALNTGVKYLGYYLKPNNYLVED